MSRPQLGSLTALAWDDLKQRYDALLSSELTAGKVDAWLEEWSAVRKVVWERWSVVKSAEGWDLRDQEAQQELREFVDGVLTPSEVADQRLAGKLLDVPGWEPGPEHAQFVRGQRYAAEVAGERNVEITAEIRALAERHAEIGANVTFTLDGRVVGGSEIDQRLQDPDRGVREAAWRAQAEPWLARREEVDSLLHDILKLRRQLARNAGLTDYRAYAWRELGRVDYTPQDCHRLHDAVASHLVPLAHQRYERRQHALGVATLRPWDLRVDPFAATPLQPFHDAEGFGSGMSAVFRNRDPELGDLFERMLEGGYVDLGWRQGKRAGGVERPFPLSTMPFVSVNGDGSEINVGTLVHEMGHAFHDHLTMRHRRFEWDLRHTDEFSELAALGMWWLVEPYLAEDRGGFYTADETRRNRILLLEQLAVHDVPAHARTDAFHHWLLGGASPDVTPDEMDAKWAELGDRFEPWIDWSGLEADRGLGWRQHWGVFSGPFYELSYILANLGALQIWSASLRNQEDTWRHHRAALARGSTLPFPELYREAGAEPAFEPSVVAEVAGFVGSQLETLSGPGSST